jgi:hypothetical protein
VAVPARGFTSDAMASIDRPMSCGAMAATSSAAALMVAPGVCRRNDSTLNRALQAHRQAGSGTSHSRTGQNGTNENEVRP